MVISEKRQERNKEEVYCSCFIWKGIKQRGTQGTRQQSKEKDHSDEKKKGRNCPKSCNLQKRPVSLTHSHTYTLCPWLKVITGSWSLALMGVQALERVTNDPESCLSGLLVQLDMQRERLSLGWKLNVAFDKNTQRRDKNRTGSRQPIKAATESRGNREGHRRCGFGVNPCP